MSSRPILPLIDTTNELVAEIDYIAATIAGSGVPEAVGLSLIITRWGETLERLAADLASVTSEAGGAKK